MPDGYENLAESQQPWKTNAPPGVKFILVNPPAGCKPEKGGSMNCETVPPVGGFMQSFIDWDTAVSTCDTLGTTCQGIRYNKYLATPNVKDCDETDMGTSADKKLCYSVVQTLTYNTDPVPDGGKPATGPDEKYFWIKKPPKTPKSEYTNLADSKQLWKKNAPADVKFILVNPPAGCKPEKGGSMNCETVPPVGGFMQSFIDWDTAVSTCDTLGTTCQGIRYNKYLGTPNVKDCDETNMGTSADKKLCYSVVQTLTYNTDPVPDGGNPATGPDEKYFWIKEGAFEPGTDGKGGSGLWCLASITQIPKVVNGTIEHVEIKDLKVGDIIQTTRGNMPISDIMKTDTKGYVHDNYVKVEKGALGENFPSEDLYVTHEHSFSLGYYKNSLLNRNIHDSEQDDMVYLHITADKLVDKLLGITRVSKEFESAINLVFDEHTSINVYGLDVVTHHPKGNPYTLPEEKYQDKSKFNSKVQKPLFANYDMLVNAKPEHMEMKDFLRGCITADLENKLNLENVNNISFAPQKSMLTEDLRLKLKAI